MPLRGSDSGPPWSDSPSISSIAEHLGDLIRSDSRFVDADWSNNAIEVEWDDSTIQLIQRGSFQHPNMRSQHPDETNEASLISAAFDTLPVEDIRDAAEGGLDELRDATYARLMEATDAQHDSGGSYARAFRDTCQNLTHTVSKDFAGYVAERKDEDFDSYSDLVNYSEDMDLQTSIDTDFEELTADEYSSEELHSLILAREYGYEGDADDLFSQLSNHEDFRRSLREIGDAQIAIDRSAYDASIPDSILSELARPDDWPDGMSPNPVEHQTCDGCGGTFLKVHLEDDGTVWHGRDGRRYVSEMHGVDGDLVHCFDERCDDNHTDTYFCEECIDEHVEGGEKVLVPTEDGSRKFVRIRNFYCSSEPFDTDSLGRDMRELITGFVRGDHCVVGIEGGDMERPAVAHEMIEDRADLPPQVMIVEHGYGGIEVVTDRRDFNSVKAAKAITNAESTADINV